MQSNTKTKPVLTPRPFSFADITEQLPNYLISPIDQPGAFKYLTSPDQEKWRNDGYVILEKFIPEHLMDIYERVWWTHNSGRPGGWPDCTPYMRHPEIRDLACYPPLMEKLKELIGDDMGVHLNLTGFVSTRRDWHGDSYLNEPFVGTFYAAIWVCLEDVDPLAGPYEYVVGSHKWGTTRRELLFKFFPPELKNDPRWPSLTEDAVSKAFRDEIARRGATIHQFLPKRGDVLIWHSDLAHRGSVPKNEMLLRKAFIAHYSGLSVRRDMPQRAQHTPGNHYFVLGSETPVY